MTKRTLTSWLKKNGAELVFVIAAIAAVCYIVISVATFDLPAARIDNEPVQEFDAGWEMVTEDGLVPVTLPYRINTGDTRTAVFEHALPDGFTSDLTMCVETFSQNLEAYIGAEPIYSYTVNGNTTFGQAFGDMWHVITIPEEFAGQTITLAVEAQGERGGSSTSTVLLGSKGSIVLHLLRQNIGTIIPSIFVFALGLGLIAISFMQKNRRAFVFLGVFSLLAAIWMVTDTKLLQFYFNNLAAVFLTSFTSFMLLPIPFFLFLKEVSNKKRTTLLNIFCLLFVAQFFINMALFVANGATLSETLIITHILLACTSVTAMVLFARDALKERNRDAWFIIIGFVLLVVAILFAIAQFYTAYNPNHSLFFRIGLAAFIVFFAIGAFNNNRQRMQEHEKLVQDSMVMDFYISSLERHNELIAQNAKKMTIFRHDLRHIVQMAQSCLNVGDVDEATRLLSTIDEAAGAPGSVYMPKEYTSNKMINTTLAYYVDLARENGIDTDVRVSAAPELVVDRAELAVVLANAMENAVNACKKLPEGQRRITVHGSLHGKQYFVEITNTCGTVLFDPQTGLPVSTREDHGYGMQSMAIFAEKSNAILRFFVENHVFHMQLLM